MTRLKNLQRNLFQERRSLNSRCKKAKNRREITSWSIQITPYSHKNRCKSPPGDRPAYGGKPPVPPRAARLRPPPKIIYVLLVGGRQAWQGAEGRRRTRQARAAAPHLLAKRPAPRRSFVASCGCGKEQRAPHIGRFENIIMGEAPKPPAGGGRTPPPKYIDGSGTAAPAAPTEGNHYHGGKHPQTPHLN